MGLTVYRGPLSVTAITFVVIDSMTISSSNKISPYSVLYRNKDLVSMYIYSLFSEVKNREMKRQVNQLPLLILVSTEVIGKFKN